MKKPKIGHVTNASTGATVAVERDPHHVMAVYQWKPVQPDRFVTMLHAYTILDENLDEWNHGTMHTHSYQVDRGVTSTIWYTVKYPDSGVRSPVLMTLTYANGKTICFASTSFGFDADPDQGDPAQAEFMKIHHRPPLTPTPARS